MADYQKQALRQMALFCPISDKITADLNHYALALAKWNKKINLVAASTLDDIWHRHFLDSAQLWSYLPPSARFWADLGSGAGFPAMILAILAKDTRPALHFTLIESDMRKCAFLRTLARELDLPVTILTMRIESVKDKKFDGVMARALADLPTLLTYTRRLIGAGGTALFLKGQSYKTEIAEAEKIFDFKAEILPSATQTAARIIKITDIKITEKIPAHA